MPKLNKNIPDFVNKLDNEISDEVGNMHEDSLKNISDSFNKALNSALNSFNSSTFDDDGFIKKMRGMDFGDKDNDTVKNILNTVKNDYINPNSINQSELLLRRDISNICNQMSEMRDVINVVRDGIVECDISTGEIARTLSFDNKTDEEQWLAKAKQVERDHKLQRSIKNFIIPKALEQGEMYIHRIPYAKLFAEIEMIREKKSPKSFSSASDNFNVIREFKESIPNYITESFKDPHDMYSDENVSYLMESVMPSTKIDVDADIKTESKQNNYKSTDTAKESISNILKNIDINTGASDLMTEMGYEGCKNLVYMEYQEYRKRIRERMGTKPETHFMEAMGEKLGNGGDFNSIDLDDVKIGKYKDIKGVYLRYLDPLKMIPMRLDRRVIGYLYATTTMDLQTNPAQPNGMIDLTYQKYSRDKSMVDKLAGLIIKSFDKPMLERNIQLKDEIAEIIMAHKFSEGKLSFIYIPENEVSRFVVNEDENGKGHSILEPSMFSARNFMMLNMYNMLYTLNNNQTRIHYLKSSGLNKDYSAQIQRTVRKFESRRIGIDDIYSYQGVLNKIGGMGEMVLPAGRNDYKALETDTIEPANMPINTEFLEQQRRQALSGTGVPHLLVINAIDEVDFAKTLEMANTRFLSTVSSYKIDFNEQLTDFYKFMLKYETDLEDDVIASFRFQFRAAKQQELSVTRDMIDNYNNLVELTMGIYYKKQEMEDEKGYPTFKQMNLRKKIAQEFLPLDFELFDRIVKEVNVESGEDEARDKASKVEITDNDLEEIKS